MPAGVEGCATGSGDAKPSCWCGSWCGLNRSPKALSRVGRGTCLKVGVGWRHRACVPVYPISSLQPSRLQRTAGTVSVPRRALAERFKRFIDRSRGQVLDRRTISQNGAGWKGGEAGCARRLSSSFASLTALKVTGWSGERRRPPLRRFSLYLASPYKKDAPLAFSLMRARGHRMCCVLTVGLTPSAFGTSLKGGVGWRSM